MKEAEQPSRRDILAAGIAGASAGFVPSDVAATPVKVRFDELVTVRRSTRGEEG